jgi:hypothetical protein
MFAKNSILDISLALFPGVSITSQKPNPWVIDENVIEARALSKLHTTFLQTMSKSDCLGWKNSGQTPMCVGMGYGQ